MKFLLIKRSYFCVLHPLLGPQIKFMNFLKNQTTLIAIELVLFHYRLKKQLKIVQAMKTKYLLQVTTKAFLNVKKKLLLTTLMQNPSLILLLQVQILLILLIMMALGDLGDV